jgi:hypothetical protein
MLTIIRRFAILIAEVGLKKDIRNKASLAESIGVGLGCWAMTNLQFFVKNAK